MTRPCKLICTKTIIDWHCLINKADIHNIVMSSAVLIFSILVIVLALSLFSFCPSYARDDEISVLFCGIICWNFWCPSSSFATRVHTYTHITHTLALTFYIYLSPPGFSIFVLTGSWLQLWRYHWRSSLETAVSTLLPRGRNDILMGVQQVSTYTNKYNKYNAQPVCIKTRV